MTKLDKLGGAKEEGRESGYRDGILTEREAQNEL